MDFLFIHIFFWCCDSLRVFFLGNQLCKTCNIKLAWFAKYYFQEISFFWMYVVACVFKIFYCSIWDRYLSTPESINCNLHLCFGGKIIDISIPAVVLWVGRVSCDRHNVANYFHLQAFLSQQRFPSFPATCSSAVILSFS